MYPFSLGETLRPASLGSSTLLGLGRHAAEGFGAARTDGSMIRRSVRVERADRCNGVAVGEAAGAGAVVGDLLSEDAVALGLAGCLGRGALGQGELGRGVALGGFEGAVRC